MYKYIVIAFLIAGLGAFTWHKNKLSEASKLAKTEVVKEYANEALEQAIEALVAEKNMVLSSLQAEQKKNSDKQTIIDRNATLIRSLQQRPKREDSSKADSAAPSIEAACTGAQLHREDGEFLAREAARADELIVDRDFYYERYEYARQQLEKMNDQD